MKRTELKRKPAKRSQPRRDWSEARAKVEREGWCRAAVPAQTPDDLCDRKLEAAHIIGREHDSKRALWHDLPMNLAGHSMYVAPTRIVPLCPKHHRAYDAHQLDLLPYLTVEEQAQAVLDAGGIGPALKRISGFYPGGAV